MIINVCFFHVKYPLLLSDISKTWIFSTDFRKILKCQISWKSIQWETNCSMRTDRHDETECRFSQFCECAPPKNLIPSPRTENPNPIQTTTTSVTTLRLYLLNYSCCQPQVHKSCRIIKLSVNAAWLLFYMCVLDAQSAYCALSLVSSI